MKKLETYYSEDRTKHSTIFLQKETFVVKFYEHNVKLGEIEYTDKSIHYVEDAAINYTQGILTKEVIEYYQKNPVV